MDRRFQMKYVRELRALVGTRPLILVGAVVIISDQRGAMLMERRRHPLGKWGLPGGLMELGESAEETARREVREETGLTVGDLNLEGVYSGPGQYLQAANGDEIHCVTIAYSSRHISGALQTDPSESLGFSWIHPSDHFDEIASNYRCIVGDYLAD